MMVFSLDWVHLAHQAFFGGVAAAGFAVLFNFSWRTLPWCALTGALALFLRTLGQEAGWSLEGATLLAALCVTCFSILVLARPLGPASTTTALVGCIPMVPGAFFAQAILGLFSLTAPHPGNDIALIARPLESLLRVLFTVCAIGTGIAVPLHFFRSRNFPGKSR